MIEIQFFNEEDWGAKNGINEIETEILIEKYGFKPRLRFNIRLKSSKGSYKLNCDHLLDMHHTRN